jgi:hypothetical protein
MNNTENDHEKTPFWKEKLLGVPLLLCPVYWSFATVAVEILNKALSQASVSVGFYDFVGCGRLCSTTE